MSNLKDQIQEDLKTAMFAKDSVSLLAIRALKASILKFETSGSGKELNDEVVIDLAKKEVKQRKDSIEQFEKAGRPELAEKEMAEIKILEKYIPTQMSEEEIKKIVEETMKETGANSAKDMGKLMGALMGKVKGKADGGLVNKVVKEALNP